MSRGPSDALTAWLSEELGSIRSCTPCGWSAGRNRVWRVRRENGDSFHAKVLGEDRAFRQEVEALRIWPAALPARAAGLPRLIASQSALRAVLMTSVPGQSFLSEAAGAPGGREVWRRAGEFLRELRSLPHVDTDPLPLRDAIPARLELWLERGSGEVTREEGLLARRLVGDGALFRDRTRVACHRDFQPRNWIVSREGERLRLSIIDFEHSRPDHPLTDLIRVLGHVGTERDPEFRELVGGLGLDRWADLVPEIRALTAVHAIGCIAWGVRHRDLPLSRQGHALLARLGSGAEDSV